jgi:5-formyltetrahydrofolate cyclo-ligase
MEASAKVRLRREMAALRESLSAEVRLQSEAAVAARLRGREGFPPVAGLGAYWAVRGELPTQGLIRSLWAEGRTVFLPRVLPGRHLEFAAAPAEIALASGAFEIPEPGSGEPAVSPRDIAVLLIPGLAFDRRGVRLGWGRGCYDRFLEKFRGQRWGLAYDFQIVDEIPEDDHDQGVDCIVTERRWIDCRKD